MATKSPLRVAFIGGRGVIGTYSGIESYYEEVGSRLASRGHHVTAYCRTHFTPDVHSYRGITVRRLPSVSSKHLETLSHSVLSTADSLFRRFDIIQFHAIGSAFLSMIPRTLGTSTVVSVRGLDWRRAKWGTLAKSFLQFGEWASARCPTRTVVVSKFLQDHYRKAHGIEADLIQNAVPIRDERPIERLKQFGVEKRTYLLYAGRLSPEKGVHDLLEALRPLPRTTRLIIAGGSSHTDTYLENLKKHAWGDVLFLGQVDREFMGELLSNCYAFVLPSYMEGLSVGLLEAISHGACILASGIPENVEAVDDAALLFPPGDVAKLRDQLELVLNDSALAADYRKKARMRSGCLLDWDQVTDQTEGLYYGLVEG